jgi:hypothetical protein
MWSLVKNLGLSKELENVEKELSLEVATVLVRVEFLTVQILEDHSKIQLFP